MARVACAAITQLDRRVREPHERHRSSDNRPAVDAPEVAAIDAVGTSLDDVAARTLYRAFACVDQAVDQRARMLDFDTPRLKEQTVLDPRCDSRVETIAVVATARGSWATNPAATTIKRATTNASCDYLGRSAPDSQGSGLLRRRSPLVRPR